MKDQHRTGSHTCRHHQGQANFPGTGESSRREIVVGNQWYQGEETLTVVALGAVHRHLLAGYRSIVPCTKVEQ